MLEVIHLVLSQNFQGVKNVSFSENFANLLNGWIPYVFFQVCKADKLFEWNLWFSENCEN